MKKYILSFLFIIGFLFLQAQDTITVLQYNLLNYGNYTSYCTQNNNNYLNKDGYIKTIVHYINPDIFTVNEISVDTNMQIHLLDSALNSEGITHFSKANFIRENTYSDLGNMLYYNHNKLGLAGHSIAQDYIRDIDVYKLYYKSSLLNSGDTTFIYCVVAHLKASSGTTNQNKRKTMAVNTMQYLTNNHPDNNYLLMGDFNLYTSSEPAYQTFTGTNYPNIQFFDPINKPGSWHNNEQFSLYHTQSTHSSRGCASGGGMDDRFDFILISNNIKNNKKKINYISKTYHAVGQDGKHFNLAINAPPTNTSVPSNVLNSLYNNSDHLPVTLKLFINETPLGVSTLHFSINEVRFNNPVRNNVQLSIKLKKPATIKIELYSLLGKRILTKNLHFKNTYNKTNINLNNIPKGIYIIRFTDYKTKISITQKLLKR